VVLVDAALPPADRRTRRLTPAIRLCRMSITLSVEG